VEKAIRVNGKGDYEIVTFHDDRKSIEIGDYVANYEKLTKTVG
jgi:hypothetical protein